MEDQIKGKLVGCIICPNYKELMFDGRADGTVVANLENYLIVPKEVFTEAELEDISHRSSKMFPCPEWVLGDYKENPTNELPPTH